MKKLFAAARRDLAPTAPETFVDDVLRAVRRESAGRPADALSVLEHLNGWFPRVALAAAALIVLCVAADLGLTAAGLPGVDEGAAQTTATFSLEGDEL